MIGLLEKPKLAGTKVSAQDFLNLEYEPDDFKYEWAAGQIITGETSMKNTERMLVKRIMRQFANTEEYREGAELFSETDVYFEVLDKVRRPDISFFTKIQIEESAQGKHPIPSWVIEIISEHDKTLYLEEKIRDYFTASVKVVWLVYPRLQVVKVYRSEREIEVSLDGVCSAHPVVSLQMSLGELFSS